jgi:biopolymer transport protein ExbD
MRLRALSSHPHDTGKVNVTPLIDVVMCLIVFYLLVGKLALDQRTRVSLPASAVGSTDPAPETLTIVVAPEGAGARVFVGGEPVEPAALTDRLRAWRERSPAGVVQIRADRTLSFGAVEPVIAACREAGLGSVTLATERQAEGKAGRAR